MSGSSQMNSNLIELINKVFEDATVKIPLMTLRGGNAVDSYDLPPVYDQQLDQLTDEYLQQFACWGLAHLDPVSWYYYLPILMSYSLRNLDKNAPMDSYSVIEATLSSLRPPDRVPSRFSLLTREQEAVIVQFLDILAFDEDSEHQEYAMQVLEEYWMPGAIYRN